MIKFVLYNILYLAGIDIKTTERYGDIECQTDRDAESDQLIICYRGYGIRDSADTNSTTPQNSQTGVVETGWYNICIYMYT